MSDTDGVRVFWAVYEDYVEDGSYGSGAFSTESGGNLFWDDNQFPLVEKKQYDALKARLEKAVGALKFYANPHNYTVGGKIHDKERPNYTDQGAVARAALKEIGE